MKKIISVLLCAALALTLVCAFAGCEKGSADNSSGNTLTLAAGEIYATVTAFDGGNTLTLSLGAFGGTNPGGQIPGGDMGGGMGGEKPDGEIGGDLGGGTLELPDGEGDAPEKPSDMPDQPSDMPDQPSDMPEDPSDIPDGGIDPGAGRGDAGNMGDGTDMTAMFSASATLTLKDVSVLYTETDGTEQKATLSDIAVGTMLKITVDGNGSVTKVVIQPESLLDPGETLPTGTPLN